MAIYYWLSSLPGTPSPEDPTVYQLLYWAPPSLQNAAHVPAYAWLAWTWRWALCAWLTVPNARVLAAFAITAGYGVLDELHQSFVPGRYASVADVLLDLAGAMLGLLLAVWTTKYAQSSAISRTKQH